VHESTTCGGYTAVTNTEEYDISYLTYEEVGDQPVRRVTSCINQIRCSHSYKNTPPAAKPQGVIGPLIYIYKCLHTYMYILTHTYTYIICIYIYVHTYTYTYTCTHTHVYTYSYTPTHIHPHTHIYIHS